MKIEGPNKTQDASKSKKKSKADGDGSFGAMVAGKASGGASAGPAQSLTRVDALLALQSVEDPTAKAAKQRMQRRAETILEELERMRMALISGGLTVGQLLRLADVVVSHREKIDDPAMTSMLDEIDLRAQVEIAKLAQVLEHA